MVKKKFKEISKKISHTGSYIVVVTKKPSMSRILRYHFIA